MATQAASLVDGISAAAYGDDVDALDSWEGIEIAVQDDGDDILLDAYPHGLDPDDYPMGRPGIGIRLTHAQARALAVALLDVANLVELSQPYTGPDAGDGPYDGPEAQ